MNWRHYGVNRTICSVLEEMRKAHATHNYSILLSLIEEVQTLANRMEAALYDYGDLEHMEEAKRELKKELKKLETDKKALEEIE